MPQFDDQPKIWTGDDVFTEDDIQEVDETSTDLATVDETSQLPSLEEQESIVNNSDLKDENKSMLGALVVSILVCVLTKADIFPIVGLNISVPFIGSILTGIVVSRGANFVNELFSKLKGGI